MRFYIGVDIGTTHIKTALFNENSDMIYIKKEKTVTVQDEFGEVYSKEFIFDTILAQIKECKNQVENIDGIAITGMAEAGVIVNPRTKEAITDIIPWFDLRTLDISDNFFKKKTSYTEENAFEITGLRNSYKYGVYKFLWLLDYMTKNGMDTRETMWLSICDYIVLKLTNEIITEPTFAARTFLYDINKGEWSAELLKFFGLSIKQLPKILKSGEIAGFFDGIPVSLCGHDHLCCAYGLEIDDKTLCNSMGTSETYIAIENSVNPEELYKNGLVFGPHVDNEKFFIMANLLSSGASVEWIRKSVQKEDISYDEIGVLLEKNSEPTGILYYPFLTGLGTPEFNSNLTASFIGLKQIHTVDYMVKSVVEGISYQSKYIVENCFSKEKEKIICIGGAVNSKQWLEIKSNVMNRKLVVTNVTEGTLFGAIKLMLDKGFKIKNNFVMSNSDICYESDFDMSKKYEKIFKDKYLKMLQVIIGYEG